MIVSDLLARTEAALGERAAGRGLRAALEARYGADLRRVTTRLRRLSAQCVRFLELYGDGPARLLCAPARINVVGEHVDYVSYIPTAALTFASREHDMRLLYRASPQPWVRGASTLPGCLPFEIRLGDAPAAPRRADPAEVWDVYLGTRPDPLPDWSNYVRGALWHARLLHGSQLARGLDFVVDSNLPAAGGASSSSALTLLAGAAALASNTLPCTPERLARDSARAEWFVGTRGGAMDHLTQCLARAGHALHLHFAGGAAEPVPLQAPELCWLTCFSVPADKSRGVRLAYNERAAVARLLVPALLDGRAADPAVLAALPESVTLADLGARFPEALEQCRRLFPELVATRRGSIPIRGRATHHVAEVARVREAVAVLRDRGAAADVARLGPILDRCHESLRDRYQVSIPEVEALRNTLRSHPAVAGARLMGGGFGGNVLALVRTAEVDAVLVQVQEHYYGPRGRDALAEGSVMVSTPGDGLQDLDWDA